MLLHYPDIVERAAAFRATPARAIGNVGTAVGQRARGPDPRGPQVPMRLLRVTIGFRDLGSPRVRLISTHNCRVRAPPELGGGLRYHPTALRAANNSAASVSPTQNPIDRISTRRWIPRRRGARHKQT